MALWYYNENPVKTTLYGGCKGLDGYLYLPGGELADVDFDVRVPGTVSLAVNTAYPKVKPHFWVGMDKPGCYDYRLSYESFPKIYRGGYAKQEFNGKEISSFPMTFFADVAKPANGIRDMFSNKADTMFAWFNHTLGVALHFMLYLGVKKIHFVGCNLGGDTDYYDDRVLGDVHRQYNRRLYNQQAVFLEEFVKQGKIYGVECVSCTSDSPINRFMPFRRLGDAIAESQKVIGEPQEVKHVLEITEDKLRKQAGEIKWVDPIREKGVIVACDSKQEWLLDWWWENYRKYNDFPVQFVDLGMTEAGADFCKARGSYTKLPELDLSGWFNKPFVLKGTQFRKTLYMDLDCKVRGSVYDFFDMKGFAISYDKPNTFSTVPRPVNSGVIVYPWGSELIDKWADKTILEHKIRRSDQDVLGHVEKLITPIPVSLHWLRIMGDNNTSVIYHYTGKIGKDLIRAELGYSGS